MNEWFRGKFLVTRNIVAKYMCVTEKTINKAMSTGTAHNNIDKEDNDNDGSIENNNE